MIEPFSFSTQFFFNVLFYKYFFLESIMACGSNNTSKGKKSFSKALVRKQSSRAEQNQKQSKKKLAGTARNRRWHGFDFFFLLLLISTILRSFYSSSFIWKE